MPEKLRIIASRFGYVAIVATPRGGPSPSRCGVMHRSIGFRQAISADRIIVCPSRATDGRSCSAASR